MINTDMRLYSFSTLGSVDAYGQPQANPEAEGNILMAINIISQAIVDNVNYKEATYIGLTMDSLVNDTYIINYDDCKLKVLYVNPKGRYKQVFLAEL